MRIVIKKDDYSDSIGCIEVDDDVIDKEISYYFPFGDKVKEHYNLTEYE